MDHVHVLVLERGVRVQCRQRVRLDAGLHLHFSCRRLECCFAWLALPAEILPVAGWSDACEPSLLADEKEPGSGEVDVLPDDPVGVAGQPTGELLEAYGEVWRVMELLRLIVGSPHWWGSTFSGSVASALPA